MKRTYIIFGTLLALTGFAAGQEIDRTDALLEGPQPATAERVQATVGLLGQQVNQQFLYTHGPALLGQDLDFTQGYSGHTAGSFFLLISWEAQPDGPLVSFFGGPPSQVLIGRITRALGPFAHDGIQTDFTVAIPQNPALLGQTWFAQALVTGGFVDLSSAVGGVLGNYL